MSSQFHQARISERLAGGALTFAVLTAAFFALPSAANAVTGDGQATSTLGALARITVAAPATTGAVACSGVLVAPRLVLTAEACFATGSGTDPQPTTTWPVAVGFTSAGTTQTITAAGIRYDHTRGLALVALAKTPTAITPVQVGSTALANGNTVRVAGFGRTDSNWISTTPHELSFTVDKVSGDTATLTGDGTLCPGDAGAPVLRDVSGGVELVGVATGAGRQDCLGDDSTVGGATAAIAADLTTLFAGDPLGRSVLTPSDNGNPAVAAAAFGSVVATGDFDKNGYLDVVVGAPKDQPGGSAVSGSVTLYRGSAAGLGTGQRLRQTDAGAGDEAGDGFGTALAVGDFNKDGYADLAVSAPTEANGTVVSGMVMVYNGGSAGLSTAAFKSQAAVNESNEVGDLFGAALAAGDFNNDGYADLAIGTPGEQQPGETTRSGTVYVLKGSSTGLVYGWALQQSLFGGANEAGDKFGAALAAGNVTGSAHADLIIGAPGEAPGTDPASGVIYVMPGAASGTGSGFARNQESNGGANEAGDEFGAALAVGDLDKDGYQDVIVGSPGEAPGSDPQAGAGTVFPGQASQLGTGMGFGESEIGDARGEDDRFGSVLSIGDVNADGYADVLIGAPGRTNGAATKAGIAYLYRGQARSTTVTNPIRATGRIRQSDVFGTDEINDGFGTGLGLADLNKDGKADAIIGAPGEAIPGGPAAGAASVLATVFSVASGTAPTPQAANPGSGPSILEDYTYPNADAVTGIKLVKGDGNITLVECTNGGAGLLRVRSYVRDDEFCFQLRGPQGYLALELKNTYQLRDLDAGHSVEAEVTEDGVTQEPVVVPADSWAVIETATLVELRSRA